MSDKIDKKLIEDFVKLKETIENTLLEIRELLNTVENPFTYITTLIKESDLGKLKKIEEPRKVIEKREKEKVEREVTQEKQENKKFEGIHATDIENVVSTRSNSRSLELLTLTQTPEINEVLEKLKLFQEISRKSSNEGIEFINAFLNVFILLRYLNLDETKVEELLNTLYNYGLISKRLFKIYIACLQILTNVLDYRENDVFQILNVLSFILKVLGNDELSRIITLILKLCKPYEIFTL